MMQRDAKNKPREHVPKRPSEVGRILDEMMERALAGAGAGMSDQSTPQDEYWRLEAERLENEGDAPAAFRARLAMRAARRQGGPPRVP